MSLSDVFVINSASRVLCINPILKNMLIKQTWSILMRNKNDLSACRVCGLTGYDDPYP